MTMNFNNHRASESGNVLFLILIAVALFAALSYAVTSSTNSGGGDANEESSLVNSAAITQYPASIKTAMIRMMVSGGIDATGVLAADNGILFTKPTDFVADLTTPDRKARAVFHPDGGGATYSPSTQGLSATGTGEWFFTRSYEITNIGTTTASSLDGNEIIAFLPDITKTICDKINEEVGISGDITHDAGITIADTLNIADVEADGGILGAAAASANGIAGKPYGCFRNATAGPYVYYHVLLEQ